MSDQSAGADEAPTDANAALRSLDPAPPIDTPAPADVPLDDDERAALQRRTVRTLFVSVLPAGASTAAGFSSAGLLGEEITGNSVYGTFAAACLTVGATIATVPLSRLMARRGRRPGLRLSWSIASVGAALAFLAAVTSFYPLLVVGILGVGVGNAAILAARYAAADLAHADDRARAIGRLVWAGSFGSVLGPTIGLGWAGSALEWVGLPELAGPYLLGTVAFAASALWIDRRLRPDPLDAAGGLESPTATGSEVGFTGFLRSTGSTFAMIFRNPSARLAVIAMLVGHAVMVGIMTATPLHMKDGEHELQIIGFVISLHIVGMYFFAPVVGRLVDALGSPAVIAAGGVILFIGAELASHTDAEDSMGVFVGLFLVGLGWSFGLIAGSSLLTASFPLDVRVTVQGAADLVMSTAGAIAALSAGVVYELAGYHSLSHDAGLLAVALTVLALFAIFRPPRRSPVAA